MHKLTPNEQKMLDGFKLPRSKEGAGKTTTAHIELRFSAHEGGTIFVADMRAPEHHDTYTGKGNVEKVADVIQLLCERALRELMQE